MKKLLVLSVLSPLTACAASWSALDRDPASPTSPSALEAPRPRLAAVLADADPLRAPVVLASEADSQAGGHSSHAGRGHHGGHGHHAQQGGHDGHGNPGQHAVDAGQASAHERHAQHGGHGHHGQHGDHSGHSDPTGDTPKAGAHQH